uniref:Reverse transcriptase domain-containing protein n=1 Tax=Tanacetum cinerariifolium TaxID=118510 RepID=A0A6L2JJX2_TANCI|nr:reverse transcriptase domain-containing protein [Tanacetum cinerariifolium]
MRTRSSCNLHGGSSSNPTSSNPKRRNRRCSKKPFIIKEFPVDTMADQRTMAELLRAPTVGYAEDRYKDLLRACPRDGFIELHQLDTFYNALNTTDQDSLNSAAGGNLLERRTQDVLTIIENKSKVCNSRKKSIVSQVKSSDASSSSSFEIAKLTHPVNQQTSDVTTAMTVILKQFHATPPPAFVKAVKVICVTCGGAHSYYQCLAADGNTFPELQDNIQGYVSAAAVNCNQSNFGYRLPGVANQLRPPVVPLSELEKIKKINEINMKAMKTQINNVKNELRNEMKNSIQASMSNKTNELKNMMASFFQMNTAFTSGLGPLPSNTIANPKGELKAITTRSGLVLYGPSVSMSPPFINLEEDEHVEETLTDSELEMLKALLSNKEKLLELANTPLNENCSAVILKKLSEKLGDLRKFLIPCGFSKLKCKALANLGARINLMPLSVWKKLGLSELISTRMTLELANQVICIPARIARDVFVPVGKPFLRTARALIDVHGKEMILCDGDERLTLNMRHDTSSYSNQPQKESINMIKIFNDSCEDFLKDLFATNHQSGNLTFSSHTDLTSPEVKDDIFDPKGGNVLIEKFLDLDSTKVLPSPRNINPLSGSTTSSSPSHLLEEFTDELTFITFPPGNDDLPFDIESDLKDIEYLLNHDPTKEMDYLRIRLMKVTLQILMSILLIPFPIFKFDNEYVYDDPFDSKGEKIKESKLLIHELDLPRSSDFLPLPKYDSSLRIFSRLMLYNNVKKIAISHASLLLKDFDPSLSDYELPFHKEVPGSKLLSFSSENEKKVFKPGILTSKGVHSSLLPELSLRGPKAFKVIKIGESPIKIFPCSFGEDIRILDVPCLHFYPL